MNLYMLVFLYFLGYLGQNISFLSNVLVVTIVCGLGYNTRKLRTEEKRGVIRPWMIQPDIEKADWINKIIATLWPLSLDQIQRLLQELSDSLTGDYFSPGIRLVLNRRSLPQPRVVGLKTHDIEERAKIVTDFTVEYESDSLISVHLFSNWTPAEIKLDISRIDFKAHLRLECDLRTMQESDLLQGIKVTALEFPQIDISFGLLSALLGVDKVVKFFIKQFLESYLIFPKKYELYSSRGSSELPIIPGGVLSIFVSEAKGLLKRDRLSLSSVLDPYVLITFSVDCRQHRFQSQTVHNVGDAVWNYMCQVPVENLNTVSSVRFKVMDSDVLTSDDHLGSAEIPLDQSQLTDKPLETWRRLYLAGNPAGKLKVMTSFSPCMRQSETGKVTSRTKQGVLTVFVDSCQNLSKLTDSHPYWRLKVSLGENVQLSRSVEMSSSPVFCQKFVFIVGDPERDLVNISVHNVKNNKVGGLLRWRVSSIAQSRPSLMNLVKAELTTKSPAGQKKDPNILLGLEYREVHHDQHLFRLFPTHSKRKILRISEEKLFKNQVSILESSTVGVTKKSVLLDLTINYDTNSSKLNLLVNSISYLNTADNVVYLDIELRKGKLGKKMTSTFAIDNKGGGKTSKLFIDKICEYSVERRGLRHSKLKVCSQMTKTVILRLCLF